MQIIDQEGKAAIDVTSLSCSSLMNHLQSNVMKLPPIETTKFNGDWQQWTVFIDTFNAMFHNNINLAPVQRFYYLRSYLEGQTADLVQ